MTTSDKDILHSHATRCKKEALEKRISNGKKRALEKRKKAAGKGTRRRWPGTFPHSPSAARTASMTRGSSVGRGGSSTGLVPWRRGAAGAFQGMAREGR